jgi:DNA polymerase-1
MRAPDGTPTHAAYGFANTLVRFISETRSGHLACCFDFALTSFRNRLDPGYKRGRTEAPPDLGPQFGLCREVCDALGVPRFEAEDFEADDVIATLGEALLGRGARIVVVSADKDLAQLVREDGRVVLHDLARRRTLDAAGVRERFGVDPERIPDFLALVGDDVDCLPGVRGVGPRTAAALLSRFTRLEDVPDEADGLREVPVRGRERLAARLAVGRERARLTRELVTLRRDVPGLRDVDLDAVRLRGARRERVAALCRRLGWGEIATRMSRL